MSTRYKREMEERGLAKPKPDFKSMVADEWAVYWRGSIILALLLGALAMWRNPGQPPLNVFITMAMLFIVMYPFYIVSKFMLFGAPVYFVIALVLFTGVPLFALAWGGLCVFISRYILVVRKAWTVELILCGALFTGAAVANRNRKVEQPQATTDAQTAAAITNATAQATQDAALAAAEAAATPLEPASTPAPATKEFRDPRGLFTVRLPEGYAVDNKSGGTRSKFGFAYGPNLNVWIIVHEMTKDWQPSAEMDQKVEAFKTGKGPFPGPMNVEKAQLADIGDASGYELIISGTTQGTPLYAQTFALVGKGMAVSIATTCTSPAERPKHDALVESIRNSFTLLDQPEPTSTRPAKSPAVRPPTEDQWTRARQSIRIGGVMQQGDRRMALINGGFYGEGDTVLITSFNKTFPFRVTAVGEHEDQVELEAIKAE